MDDNDTQTIFSVQHPDFVDIFNGIFAFAGLCDVST